VIREHLCVARDHAVDFDSLTVARIQVDNENRGGPAEPCAQLTFANEVGGSPRAVRFDDPDGLTLMELAISDACHLAPTIVIHSSASIRTHPPCTPSPVTVLARV
jgi:hypothetical protein